MQAKSLIDDYLALPPTCLWRLFIDNNRQRVGPLGFDEREPNYLKSLQHGFHVAASHFHDSLSVDLLVTLHDASINYTQTKYGGTTAEVAEVFYEDFIKGLRTHTVEFGLSAKGENKNLTVDGLRALLEKIADGDKYFKITVKLGSGGIEFLNTANVSHPVTDEYVNAVYDKIRSPENWSSVTLVEKSPQVIASRLARIIAVYEQDIEKAKTDDEKDTAITTFIHELQLSHAFSDANLRTFGLLLLPIELAKRGLLPTILENPNRVAGYSVREIVEEIKEGRKRFRAYCEQKDHPTPGHENDTLLYLNDTTSELVIHAATQQISNWSKVHSAEQKNAIKLLKETLHSLHKQEFTFDEVNTLVEMIAKHLQPAIYQKAGYQTFFQHSEYGIYFDTPINRFLEFKKGLSQDRLAQDIMKTLVAVSEINEGPS